MEINKGRALWPEKGRNGKREKVALTPIFGPQTLLPFFPFSGRAFKQRCSPWFYPSKYAVDVNHEMLQDGGTSTNYDPLPINTSLSITARIATTTLNGIDWVSPRILSKNLVKNLDQNGLGSNCRIA